MASKRSTHRSSKGDHFVWRDAKSGRYLDVKIPDPHVRHRDVPIEKIRKAVQKSGGGSVQRKK
jgi:hypothetical protein